MALVFFIHGVATKDSGYSRKLEALIREEFNKKDKPLPHFYASFWGNILKQTGQIWNWVHEDLQDFKKFHPNVDAKAIFRYQDFRQDFISEFFGDILTYFNNASSIPTIFFRDKYIWADANGAERGARTFGQAHAAMAIRVSDSHGYYWGSRGYSPFGSC